MIGIVEGRSILGGCYERGGGYFVAVRGGMLFLSCELALCLSVGVDSVTVVSGFSVQKFAGGGFF